MSAAVFSSSPLCSKLSSYSVLSTNTDKLHSVRPASADTQIHALPSSLGAAAAGIQSWLHMMFAKEATSARFAAIIPLLRRKGRRKRGKGIIKRT